MRIDPFFQNQPTPKFIEDLTRPIHESAPTGFSGRTVARDGEVCVSGLYIKTPFPEDEGLLSTSYDDFNAFLRITGVGGDAFPLILERGAVSGEESFCISVSNDAVTVTAEDVDGVRRALVYLEEEMTKREGALLPLGVIKKTAYIKRRITRGFFSPTNRPPKFGDELLDSIDYYPENYLMRLMHNGTNGLWIYTSFRALIDMPTFNQNKDEVKARIEKLERVVARCKKYGVKVYVFAIEPFGLAEDEADMYKNFLGGAKIGGRYPICLRQDAAREYVIGAIEKLFTRIPDLGGYIDITAGERVTTCPSTRTYSECPRCKKYSRGENLAYCVDIIREGLRRANTGAQFISWTYGHRYWVEDDVREYARLAPRDVILMQNFEDGGINTQLGKERIALDYWLSYVGPCKTFAVTAEEVKKRGGEMWAKMQICNSHELATVPYIPVPGIIYDKYKKAREVGVVGIMECWYFGNYPSLMNRASTALSYLDSFDSKEEFLYDFAARMYGESLAGEISEAFRLFEEGYKSYPTNVMFNYYGPMHDGVVWELSLLPKNLPLPRTWQLVDPPDGDRIGECLYSGHTLDEAITLTSRMRDRFAEAIGLLSPIANEEIYTDATALSVLFSSGCNILEFYRYRSELGCGKGAASEALEKMKSIALLEIENSNKMIDLVEKDSRLGYHSEAEGFKFFREKLLLRIEKLKALIRDEFPVVSARISEGKAPLGYYYAEGEDAYILGSGEEKLDTARSFSMKTTEKGVLLSVTANEGDTIYVGYEFDLFIPETTFIISKSPMTVNGGSLEVYEPPLGLVPNGASHHSLFGEKITSELQKHSLHEEKLPDGRVLYTVETTVPKEKWNRKTAIKMCLTVGGVMWRKSPEPHVTLGREREVADEYGFILP